MSLKVRKFPYVVQLNVGGIPNKKGNPAVAFFLMIISCLGCMFKYLYHVYIILHFMDLLLTGELTQGVFPIQI